jgi:hypothetical protein
LPKHHRADANLVHTAVTSITVADAPGIVFFLNEKKEHIFFTCDRPCCAMKIHKSSGGKVGAQRGCYYSYNFVGVEWKAALEIVP